MGIKGSHQRCPPGLQIIPKGEAEAGATNDEADSKDVASDEAKSGSSEQDVLDASSSDEDRTTRAIDVQPNSVTLSGGLKSADEESVLGNELGVEEEDVLCEGSENSGTGLVYKETGVLSEVNEGHYPKAILLVEDRMNIDKVNLLDLRLSCAGYFPMDDALDCRPVSANRDLQIDARSCIVSGAHDLLVKMPKQELMSKVSATIPGAGKQGQIDELMPKGMSGGSLGTTEGMPSDHQRLDEIPDPFLAADIVSSVPKFKRAGSGSQDQGIERDPKTWASVVASHGMSSPITGGLRLNHRSFSGSNLEYFAPNIDDKVVRFCLRRKFGEEVWRRFSPLLRFFRKRAGEVNPKSVWVEKRSFGAVKEEEEVDLHHEVKGGPEIRKETIPEVSSSGPKESSMDEVEDVGDEGGSGDGEQDDGFSDSSGSDSVPEKGGCEEVEDANQGPAAIQVSLPDSSPACEGGVFTDSERRLSLALEDIREGNNGDEIFCAHHMFDKLPHNICSYLDANESKPGGILKSGNSDFVPELSKEGNAGYVAVSEIQGIAVPLSKAQVGALRPPTGLAPGPSVAQGDLNRSWAKVVTSSRGPNLDGGFPRLSQRSSSGKLDYFEPKEIGILKFS
ncbi:hypothetical protein U1Q18_040762 [Sarracenia purpurea var. burkii]